MIVPFTVQKDEEKKRIFFSFKVSHLIATSTDGVAFQFLKAAAIKFWQSITREKTQHLVMTMGFREVLKTGIIFLIILFIQILTASEIGCTLEKTASY